MSVESPRALMLDPVEESLIECARGLSGRGWDVDYAPSFEEALALVSAVSYDLVFIDLMLPDAYGLDAWTYIKKLYPDTLGIITTASASVRASVNALAPGILAFSVKPLEPNLVYNWADYAREYHRAAAENRELQRNLVGLGNLISSIASASTPAEVLESALAHLPAVFKPDWGVLALRADKRTAWSDWLLRSFSVDPKDLSRPQSDLLAQFMQEAVELQQTVLIDRSPMSEFKYGIMTLRQLCVGKLGVAPVLGHTRVFGAVGVIYDIESRGIFSLGQVQELTIIGRSIGLVLDNLYLPNPMGVNPEQIPQRAPLS